MIAKAVEGLEWKILEICLRLLLKATHGTLCVGTIAIFLQSSVGGNDVEGRAVLSSFRGCNDRKGPGSSFVLPRFICNLEAL